jgi:predicted nucleotidyltransferase
LIAALKRWVKKAVRLHPETVRLGYLGSYARGDWGVGSDLDLIVIVEDSSTPFMNRVLDWDVNSLPVPAEIMVYTEKEWQQMKDNRRRYVLMIEEQAVWIFSRDKPAT